MPFLSDEDVLRFNTKIDELEQKRSMLDELNDTYMRDLEIKKSQLIKSLVVGGVLLFLLLGSLSIHFFGNDTSANQKIKASKKEVVKKVAKTKTVAKQVTVKQNSPLYGVQIGAFQEHNVNYTLSITKMPKGNLNRYVVGGFAEQAAAENLKMFLRESGLKGAFVVKLEDE